MKRPNFRNIPPPVRWGGLVTFLLLAVFLGWLLFLRPSQSSGPLASPTPLPRPALGKIVTYTAYKAAVDGALNEVRAARAAAGGRDERKKHIKEAANRLTTVEGAGVSLPGGAAVAEIDNTAAIEALGADDPNLDALESGLGLLSTSIDHVGMGYLAGTRNGAEADAALRRVLSDPLFNYDAQLSPLQRLVKWLNDLTGKSDQSDTLARLVIAILAGLAAATLTFLASDRLGSRRRRLALSVVVGIIVGGVFYGGLQSLSTTAEILGLVGLVVAAVAVGLFTTGLGRGSAPAPPRALSDLASALGMHAGEARRKAGDAADAGDFRGAIRYRCLAVLLTLDEAGMLAFDRSATNREYLFRAQGLLHDELQPLLDRFDDVWYGGAPAGEAEWQSYDAGAGRVEAMVAVGDKGKRRAA